MFSSGAGPLKGKQGVLQTGNVYAYSMTLAMESGSNILNPCIMRAQ